MYGLTGSDDSGDVAVGDQVGEKTSTLLDPAPGEKGTSGDISTLGDHTYGGLTPRHRFVSGLGVEPIVPNGKGLATPGIFVGISMPYLHFSASSSRSKQPVPAVAS